MTANQPAAPSPISRDAERTQAAIFNAARDEFAEHGFAGARVDRIAQRAGINKRLLYYYYGNKDDLFLAVLERTYGDIRAAEQKLHLDLIDPVDALRQLVAFTWSYHVEHPEFISLLGAENLLRAKHLKKSEKILEMNSPLIEMLDRVLERGRREGIFRAGIDPVQLYISIASLCFFYLSNNYTLSAIFGRNLLMPKALAERLSHITDLVLGYALL